ncbi:hypothetical protein BJ508DRAFT_328906 [Ascobolus immersus RN42]|uniref:Uncharacterized protein n=1 Tax=Ascobolus immersus RN42 TaxID=1160509 RepID=A0A3N4HYE4_ASCIM|nr:hypothetical protein BJ508DRAFT_328906 [Ascobolus immersus RN42]
MSNDEFDEIDDVTLLALVAEVEKASKAAPPKPTTQPQPTKPTEQPKPQPLPKQGCGSGSCQCSCTTSGTVSKLGWGSGSSSTPPRRTTFTRAFTPLTLEHLLIYSPKRSTCLSIAPPSGPKPKRYSKKAPRHPDNHRLKVKVLAPKKSIARRRKFN